ADASNTYASPFPIGSRLSQYSPGSELPPHGYGEVVKAWFKPRLCPISCGGVVVQGVERPSKVTTRGSPPWPKSSAPLAVIRRCWYCEGSTPACCTHAFQTVSLP